MPNSNISRLAKKLNNMKNPSLIGTSIGEVVKTSPLTLSIADGEILLTEGDELYVCESLKEVTKDVTLSWDNFYISDSAICGSGEISGNLTVSPDISMGDNVLVIPTADEQTWIAVEKIGDS